LFGHEKGAFTGAVTQKKGKFEIANRGTVFLDEVGERMPAMQAKLLRALQEREIERVGGTRAVKIDIRLIAATNRDLEKEVANHAFRQDLYYRLNVVSVRTPALRERPEDVAGLARHFIARLSRDIGRTVRGLSPIAQQMLEKYDWPGNVRELQNVIERAIVLGSTDVVLPEDLPGDLLEAAGSSEKTAASYYYERVNATKRELLENAFTRTGGNYKEAAKLLGLNATYVFRLIQNLKLTHVLKPARTKPEKSDEGHGRNV